MAKEQKPSKLELFVGVNQQIGTISEAIKIAETPGQPDDYKDRARETVARAGYAYYDQIVDNDSPGRVSSFNSNTQYAEAKRFAQEGLRVLDGQLGNMIVKDLDDMISELSNDGLERILSDKKTAEIVASNASGHDEFISLYVVAQTYDALAEKAKEGKLDEKELKTLSAPLIESNTTFALQQLSNSGVRDPLIAQNVRAIMPLAVGIGMNRDSYGAIAKSLAGDARKALDEYTSKSGQNLQTYVGSALRELASSPQTVGVTRDLIYRAAV